MSWAGNERRLDDNDRAGKEERRRKKMERQEKRVERLNEPLLAWVCRTFRVVTVLGTLLFSLVKIWQGVQLGVEHLAGGVLFNALATWTVFGLIWALSAAGQALSLKKSDGDHEQEIRAYWRDVIIAVAGGAILFVAVMMFP